MIRCPHCSSSLIRVQGHARDDDSADHNYLRRYRKCKTCGKGFKTREFVEGDTFVDIEKVRIALSLIGQAREQLKSSRADYHREWRRRKALEAKKNHS